MSLMAVTQGPGSGTAGSRKEEKPESRRREGCDQEERRRWRVDNSPKERRRREGSRRTNELRGTRKRNRGIQKGRKAGVPKTRGVRPGGRGERRRPETARTQHRLVLMLPQVLGKRPGAGTNRMSLTAVTQGPGSGTAGSRKEEKPES
ncbi:hypothetical protein NDU88_003429 [Pleurodeles waltl]|uniref:Uncharacterized protein n=1 Tax=Pleurodeles waltl TaxID=8319 RepID=A0AAV7SG45_PLEWA|nr:hypothetical protein NDU88_003429 [Pleurodeles waltl]